MHTQLAKPRIYWPLAAALGGLALLYLAMVHFYHSYFLDDGWSLSLAYYYLNLGYEFDLLNGQGSSVTAYFTKTHAYVYGLWAELVGWGRTPHQLLSVTLSWLGAWLYMRAFLKLGATKSVGYAFLVTLLLTDAFVGSAVVARTEALVFFLGACALCFAAHRYWFWATLVALFAFETHPIGFIYSFLVLLVWLVSTELSRFESYKSAFLRVFPAAILGVGYYVLLHYEHLASLPSALTTDDAGNLIGNSFLIQYFGDLDFWAGAIIRWQLPELFIDLVTPPTPDEVPELMAILISYALLLYKPQPQSVLWRFLVLAPLALILADLVSPRGAGGRYIMHAYPAFMMIVVYAWSKVIKWPIYLVPLCVALYMAPQYGYLIYKHWGFYFPEYIKQVREHSDRTEATMFVGNSAMWFAFNHDLERSLQFHSDIHPDLIETVSGQQFVWLRDYNRRKGFVEFPFESPELFLATISDCPQQILSSFNYGGHFVQLEEYDCRAQPEP